ncbi:hypothetical protein [Streptomyces sp. TRM68367]|uniref:hypothetical protein n=1 Tax=Streptomyces sp. TRM68367 TaxID=2758415 RepID=UPI00165B914F|nr:hypothetical protein [Streptomyces sp. TRM68367]MBC9728948.1 hypothetical protein [Streptomyces sp. TRM68367]
MANPVGEKALGEMLRTVPVRVGESTVDHYGLGIYAVDLPCGRFWGHDGSVFGAGTVAWSSRDGKRQTALGFNLMKYQRLNEDGSPIDDALRAHLIGSVCPDSTPRTATMDARRLLPEELPATDLAVGAWGTHR